MEENTVRDNRKEDFHARGGTPTRDCISGWPTVEYGLLQRTEAHGESLAKADKTYKKKKKSIGYWSQPPVLLITSVKGLTVMGGANKDSREVPGLKQPGKGVEMSFCRRCLTIFLVSPYPKWQKYIKKFDPLQEAVFQQQWTNWKTWDLF